jgi:hypothetical protein
MGFVRDAPLWLLDSPSVVLLALSGITRTRKTHFVDFSRHCCDRISYSPELWRVAMHVEPI